MRVVAFVGLSGVGKTFALTKAADKVPFVHLQASALLKAEMVRTSAITASSEDLRLGRVQDNQELLVAGFHRAVEESHGETIVFDAHTVIDGADGLIEISATIFRDVGTSLMIALCAEPSEILSRRESDSSRTRPVRSVEQLAHHQSYMLSVTERICQELSIPMVVVRTDSLDDLYSALLAT
jgi:adenylate kinase